MPFHLYLESNKNPLVFDTRREAEEEGEKWAEGVLKTSFSASWQIVDANMDCDLNESNESTEPTDEQKISVVLTPKEIKTVIQALELYQTQVDADITNVTKVFLDAVAE